MPSYRYRAVSTSGRITNGSLVAANEGDLAVYLRESGLELINARDAKPHHLKLWQPSFTMAAVVPFTVHMRDILKAGVPFADALRSVMDMTTPGPLYDTLADIYRHILQGVDIAQAFARHRTFFSPVFVAILSAGVASGDLTQTFVNLARYSETQMATQRYIKRALRYPIFLLFTACGVVTFMMALVVPQVLQFLNSLDVALPLATRILIATSGFFAGYWWVVLLTILLAITAVMIARHASPRVAHQCDTLLLKTPVVGDLVLRMAQVRFMESMALLFQSNIGILASLREARATLTNRVLEHDMIYVEERVRSGCPLSVATADILPSLAVRMIKAGERSGLLGQSLNDAAALCQREMQERVDTFLAMIEPALTIMIGGILAWVVLAVLGPIYSNLARLNMIN